MSAMAICLHVSFVALLILARDEIGTNTVNRNEGEIPFQRPCAFSGSQTAVSRSSPERISQEGQWWLEFGRP
jgi:hypothetical protein